MRKKVVLLGSISIAIVGVVLVITSMSAIAGNVWSDGKIEPQPPIPRIEKEYVPNYQVELSTGYAGIGLVGEIRTPTTISSPNWIPSAFGIPAPGELVLYSYSLTPESDGENIDAIMMYLPTGWEVESVSPPPAKNTDCPGTAVLERGITGDREVIYWGNIETFDFDINNPPDNFDRSGCGIYAADGVSEINVWVQVRVSPEARTCPGTNTNVGIPFDGPNVEFSYTPVLTDSLATWLFGAGNIGASSTLKLNLQQPCPIPEIRLEKYVGYPGDCPATITDYMLVQPGTDIEYCIKIFNDSPFITMTNNLIIDDQIEIPPLEFPEGGMGPGVYGNLTLWETIDGPIDTSITNTATWTASTVEGYGQTPQDDPTAPFSNTTYYGMVSDSAIVEIVEQANFFYFPLISYNFPLTIPVQISPENGAVLDTLIPELVIEGGENPPYDIIRVYLGTSRSTMTPIHHLQSTADTLFLSSNLEPATEYFWRLCFVEDVDGADLQCSQIWSFTTGSGGIIPGVPTLSSPEDGATGIELDDIILSWDGVENALLYEVFLHPEGDEYNYLITTNQLSANYSNYFDFDPDTLHTWRVRARNDYAWGEFSETWSFTTSSSR